MSHKPKKYPFFTRLKRAWAVYNEYMPINDKTVDTDISWYDPARQKRNSQIEAEARATKAWAEKGVNDRVAKTHKKWSKYETFPADHVRVKHTLVKKKKL